MKFVKLVILFLVMAIAQTQSYADPVTDAVIKFYHSIAERSQFPKQEDMTCQQVRDNFGNEIYEQLLKAAEAKKFLGYSQAIYVAKSVRSMQLGHELGLGLKAYPKFPVDSFPIVTLTLQSMFSFEDAINSLFEQANQGGVVLDCNQAAMLASLVAWKERMKLKNKDPEEVLKKQRNSLGEVDLDAFTSTRWEELQKATFGDTFYISGHPQYLNHYPNGTSQGQNTILVGQRNGEGLFMGYGPFFSKGPRSLSEIQEELADKYIKNGKLGTKAQALEEIKKRPIRATRLSVEK